MELDEAFKMAVKKFYEGSTHQNVDKYSKNPFGYSFSALDEVQKNFSKNKEEVEGKEPLDDLEDALEGEVD